MKLTWTNEQQSLCQLYAELGKQIKIQRLNYDEFDHGAWRLITQHGIWKLSVPSEYGGNGKSWWEFIAALEGLASTINDLGFLLSMVAHIGAIRVLLNYGTSKQIEQFLPDLLGGKIASTAITEETGGSDVARIKLSATQLDDHYILNGKKSHITNAPVADYAVLVGRIPALGAKNDITLFYTELNVAGIKKSKAENMLGNKTSPTGDLEISNLMINEQNILGKPGSGLSVLYNMISLDRLLYAVIAASYSKYLLNACIEYTSQRQAFNRPINDYQYVQGKLIDIKINMEASRFLAFAALEKLITNDKEASLFCSIAKLVGTEGLCQTAQHMMQLHGHSGYMEGDIARVLRDTMGTRIAGGTSDIQRVNIFNQLIKIFKEEY